MLGFSLANTGGTDTLDLACVRIGGPLPGVSKTSCVATCEAPFVRN
jgi:hypothetical protein